MPTSSRPISRTKTGAWARTPSCSCAPTSYRWAKKIAAWCPELGGRAGGPRHRRSSHRKFWHMGAIAKGAWSGASTTSMRRRRWPYHLGSRAVLRRARRWPPEPLLPPHEAAGVILGGYRKGLGAPRPTLLDERKSGCGLSSPAPTMIARILGRSQRAIPTPKPPTERWLRASKGPTQGSAHSSLLHASQRGGGLGRPRYVAVAAWRGGQIVREGKAWVPSAWDWAHKKGIGFFGLFEGGERAFPLARPVCSTPTRTSSTGASPRTRRQGGARRGRRRQS